MIEREIQLYIEEQLSGARGRQVRISGCSPVGGGSINRSFQISTDDGQCFFAKINDSRQYPGLFKEESKGLKFLQQFVCTPRIILEGEAGNRQLLVLEWIEPAARTDRFWRCFGEDLARLHQQSQPLFGFSSDNYMGALRQLNTPHHNWVDFFVACRLRPQTELALSRGLLPSAWMARFEELYQVLPSVFPDEKPGLLHGDLWSGNFICNQQAGVTLIDPAVYFGHRSMDLAMTTLFGRFDRKFYESYQYHFPTTGNEEEQWQIANLYPLLIHLNLFGTSYLSPIRDALARY